MKIIYSGGYNKHSAESVKSSLWYRHKDELASLVEAGEKVAIVTLANPDSYYDNFIRELPSGLDIIDSTSKNVYWGVYDFIMIPGGNTLNLYKGMVSKGFELKKIKKDATLLGDSAGAYMLSSYFYDSPSGEDRGRVIEFYQGFNPEGKNIVVAHINNNIYTNSLLLEKVSKLAEEQGLTVFMLEENQEKEILQ